MNTLMIIIGILAVLTLVIFGFAVCKAIYDAGYAAGESDTDLYWESIFRGDGEF